MKRLLPLIFLVAVLVSALACPVQAEEISRPITAWPFLYHRADEQHAETDVLWPVYHFERKETWSKHSVGGILFTTQADPAKDFRKTSVLWPLSTYKGGVEYEIH